MRRSPTLPAAHSSKRQRLAAPPARSSSRRAFTLLEIILALAILAGALAALGEVMRAASRNAAQSRDETEAHIVAASIMDELLSGARTLAPVSQQTYDGALENGWLYSITFEDTGFVELVGVRVVVEQATELQPDRFELVRWLPNPDAMPQPTSTGGTSL